MVESTIFNDKKSRYRNLDNTKIVFLTPTQVVGLNIGISASQWKENEMEIEFPFLVDSLKEMVKETTLGETNGSEIQLPVHDSDARVVFCIEINGKLCKLQTEEWDFINGISGIPVETQLKLFQRLISENQITLDDLAAVDINNDVYKQLVANDIDGPGICVAKCKQIDDWVKKQSNDKRYIKMKNRIINNL